jgi:superfamily II RNA helicase
MASMDGPLARLLPSALPGASVSDDVMLDAFLQYLKVEGLTLYPAQEEAILELFAGKNVILNTPTGSGKTLVALALIFRALCRGERVYYTAPIKALASEKFFDLTRRLSADLVGLATGDASVNRDAPVQCATAEILAQLAMAQGEHAAVDCAVMDEFHYYSDRERGRAWQVPLLTLKNTQFLLMSATLGPTERFERALRERTGRETVVVKSNVRPVPLEFAYKEVAIHETMSTLLREGKTPVYLVNFSQRSAAEEAQNLMSIDLCTKEEKKAIATALVGARFSTPYGKEISRYLRHGIGVHHAGLLPKYRLMVEKLAQKGLLKVISGTDTLGVGVNVPIRSVLFTKLCKYDGERTGILTARDFHQIAGRAGRKGFDTIGYVYAQAPEHVVENLRLESKAAQDPAKKKKIVRKKPPDFGYVHWDRATFERLQTAEPEPLVSRFSLSHSMVMDGLLRQDGGGCRVIADLLHRCHETEPLKRAHARSAIEMSRHLIRAGILEQWTGHTYALSPAVKPDVALQQPLSLFLLELLEKIKAESQNYALDVLSLIEAIAEDPRVILERQQDRAKRDLLTKLKSEGVEYEARMEQLEKLTYPKPNAEYIYAAYDDFCLRFPWAKQERVSPKGVARMMVEEFLSFNDQVRELGAERTEGVLLRYLSDILRILERTIPEHAKSEELMEVETFLASVVRKTDSSLLDEWEALQSGELLRAPTADGDLEPEGSRDITKPPREFAVLIRNTVFSLLRSISHGSLEEGSDALMGLPKLEVDKLAVQLSGLVVDARGRRGDLWMLEMAAAPWTGTQRLLFRSDADEEDEGMRSLLFQVDHEKSKEEGRVVLSKLRLND